MWADRDQYLLFEDNPFSAHLHFEVFSATLELMRIREEEEWPILLTSKSDVLIANHFILSQFILNPSTFNIEWTTKYVVLLRN